MNEIMQDEKKINKRVRKTKAVRTTAITFVCFVLGLLVAMQYKNIREMKAQEDSSFSTLYEYQKQLIKLQEEVDNLTQDKAELQKKVDLFEIGNIQHQVEHLQNELKNVKLFAGLSKVKGPGVEITIELSDPYALGSMATTLLQFINELKASTAQAIAINGVRLGPMSEVRVVTTSLVIDGQVYGQPINISVIGDTNNLLSILPSKGGFPEQFRKYGAVTITSRESIILDAYDIEKIKRDTNKLTPIDE